MNDYAGFLAHIVRETANLLFLCIKSHGQHDKMAVAPDDK